VTIHYAEYAPPPLDLKSSRIKHSVHGRMFYRHGVKFGSSSNSNSE